MSARDAQLARSTRDTRLGPRRSSGRVANEGRGYLKITTPQTQFLMLLLLNARVSSLTHPAKPLPIRPSRLPRSQQQHAPNFVHRSAPSHHICLVTHIAHSSKRHLWDAPEGSRTICRKRIGNWSGTDGTRPSTRSHDRRLFTLSHAISNATCGCDCLSTRYHRCCHLIVSAAFRGSTIF